MSSSKNGPDSPSSLRPRDSLFLGNGYMAVLLPKGESQSQTQSKSQSRDRPPLGSEYLTVLPSSSKKNGPDFSSSSRSGDSLDSLFLGSEYMPLLPPKGESQSQSQSQSQSRPPTNPSTQTPELLYAAHPRLDSDGWFTPGQTTTPNAKHQAPRDLQAHPRHPHDCWPRVVYERPEYFAANKLTSTCRSNIARYISLIADTKTTEAEVDDAVIDRVHAYLQLENHAVLAHFEKKWLLSDAELKAIPLSGEARAELLGLIAAHWESVMRRS